MLLPDLRATEALAARLAALARPGDALLLSGPLGAGKSALARAFLRGLTGDPGLEVPSPSFTLVQSYALPGGGQAHHFDLYRLAGPPDLRELGGRNGRHRGGGMAGAAGRAGAGRGAAHRAGATR